MDFGKAVGEFSKQNQPTEESCVSRSPATVSVLCSVIAWEQDVGSMATTQILQWISEAAARSTWPIMVLIVGDLQHILVATTLRLLGLGSSSFLSSVTMPIPPPFFIHIILALHAQISYHLLCDLGKQVAKNYPLFGNLIILCILLCCFLLSICSKIIKSCSCI